MLFFRPNSFVILFPAKREYKDSNIGVWMVEEEKREECKTEEGFNKLFEQEIGDIADGIEFVNKERQVEFHYQTRGFPWTHGRVALLGDSSYAVGPYAGIGVNLLQEHIRRFGIELKEKGFEKIQEITEELSKVYIKEWDCAYAV